MKNFRLFVQGIGTLAVALVFTLSTNDVAAQQNYEFTSFTVVESIIPNGIGRSRIIHSLEERNFEEFTKERSEEDNSRNKASRKDIRVDNFEETKLLNFYNLGGIRFQNIAANDAVINSKVNAMMAEGWELVNIIAGVESDAGKDDGEGIFITRFYFKRAK